MSDLKRWVVGVSGASGIRYALRLLEVLLDSGVETHVVFSDSALRVMAEEEGLKLSHVALSASSLLGREVPDSLVQFYGPKDIAAKIASGSFKFEGMVVVPCSMGTMASIAHGLSNNLLQRAADVTIKERRKLILVPRETPLSTIHLENMLSLSRAGAVLIPAMPGFYHKPQTIQDMVDMLVMKILDQMGIESNLVTRWREAPIDDRQLKANLAPSPDYLKLV